MPVWREFAAWGAASLNLRKRKKLRKRLRKAMAAVRESFETCVMLLQELPQKGRRSCHGSYLHAGVDTDTGVLVPKTLETLVLRECVSHKYWTAVQVADTAFISVHLRPAERMAVVHENVDTMEEITKEVRSWETGEKPVKYLVVGIDANASLLGRVADVTGEHVMPVAERRKLKQMQAEQQALKHYEQMMRHIMNAGPL